MDLRPRAQTAALAIALKAPIPLSALRNRWKQFLEEGREK